MSELNYKFRERMLEVHKKDRRVQKPLPDGHIEINETYKIVYPKSSDFLYSIAKDLSDYFVTSMNLEVQIGSTEAPSVIIYEVDEALGASGTFLIDVKESGVRLIGTDERACAQASYYLEDMMNYIESPYLKIGKTRRTPRFKTRMVHSGFACDIYPDDYLNSIAHQGINTILLFTRGIDHTSYGHTDFNDIIYRASRYGIDAYAYSYMKSRLHPSDPGAEEFYDGLYGELFRKHPGFKGIIFVGESVEFPSKDERTTMRLRLDNLDENGNLIIKGKPSPGWFPCYDYPEWLAIVKRIIRRERPDADIVFWTYNWGYHKEELRIELINNLPTDISLEATFEMFEDFDADGVPSRTTDYSLSFAGPGKYFLSEARAAKRRGIPLYSMTNSAGLTWDVGTVPYEPTPYQWLERYRGMIDCNEKYGLVGLMECHHYGFYPSFISELAKEMFYEGEIDGEAALDRIIIRDFGEENLDKIRSAYRLLSDGIRLTPSTNEDQYGPMRIGPSYPMILFGEDDIKIPFGEWGYHGGNKITSPNYSYPLHRPGWREKMDGEIRIYKAGAEKMIEGANIIRDVALTLNGRKRDEALRIAGIGEFMGRTALTTHNVKRWYKRKVWLMDKRRDDFDKLLSEMAEIAKDEIANAEATLPLVDFDSRLGYEPTMEYMGHREAIEWKLAILHRMLDENIPELRELGYVKDEYVKEYPRGLWE